MKKANMAKAIPIHSRQGKKIGSHSPTGKTPPPFIKGKGMKVDDHKPTIAPHDTPDKGSK